MITWAYERHMNIPCNFTHGSPHSLTIEGGAHKPTNKQKKQGVRITLFAITVFFFLPFISFYSVLWHLVVQDMYVF